MMSDKNRPTNLKYDNKRFKAGETNILYDNLSEGKKNLFIVSTPLQLLSAIEAQNHFETQNNILVILFFVIEDGKKINDMFKLSEYFPYSKLMTFQNSNKRNFFAFNSYLEELNRAKYNYLFFGYTTPLYRRMVANTKYQKLFLLDNGMNSLQVHKQFFDKDRELNTSFLEKRIKDKLYHTLYLAHGNRIDTDLKDLNFFTACDLDAFEDEEIVKHDYRYTIKLFKEDATLLERYALLINDHGWQGNIKLINLKDRVSVENRRYMTTAGDKLYIYPDGIENKRYERKVLSFLRTKEQLYLNGEFVSIDEQMQKLQYSLLFFDALGFEKNLNTLIESHMDKIKELLDAKEERETEEFVLLLKSLNQVMRFLFYATNYFILHKEYFVKMESFYNLFDLILLYNDKKREQKIPSKERKAILSEMVWIFAHYAKRASYFGEVEKINDYLLEHHKVFRHRLLDVLLNSSSYCYHKAGCSYENLLYGIYSQYIEKKRYEQSTYWFLRTLKMANFLGEEMDSFCEVYLEEKIVIQREDVQVGILQILLESPIYYYLIREELWRFYADDRLSRSHRVRAGHILIESDRKRGNIKKARALYFQLYETLDCLNRAEAVRYIEQLEPLGLLYSHKDIFERLFINFIAYPFLEEMGVDITREFLLYQFKLSRFDKLKDLSIIYQKRFKPKVQRLIEEGDYKSVLYINPFNEINNDIFPVHIYDRLLDEKILIVNIERANLNFFNEYPDTTQPILGNFNDAIIGSNKHWNEHYNEWIEDFKGREVVCGDLNIYQGIFEQISRVQKRFSIDYDSIATKMLWRMFKRRVDRNIMVSDYFLDTNRLPVSFLSITSHYTPWSTLRDRSFQIDDPKKFSFIHACPTYENYVYKMQNNRLITIAPLNLTAYRKSRIAGFGASELFSKYANREYESAVVPMVQEESRVEDIDAAYLREINQAKKEGKTVICLLGKIVYDLAVPNMRGTFSDMKAWVQETVEFVSKRDDVFVLVKPHPHEINYSISQYPNESFLDFVEVDSPNIYLMGHHEAGLDKLIDHIDAFILWNGTSVIELANAKQNIIVCDDWAKRDYPIDLYQPVDKEEYFSAILNAKVWDKDSPLAIRRQKLAYLYIEYMKNGDFFAINSGVVRSSTNIDWNNTHFNMDELFMEFNNPTQDWVRLIGELHV